MDHAFVLIFKMAIVGGLGALASHFVGRLVPDPSVKLAINLGIAAVTLGTMLRLGGIL